MQPESEKPASLLDMANRAHYNENAECYDSHRYRSNSGVFFTQLEGLVVESWACGEPGSLGLDLPCGTGRLTASLANRCEKVIAGDISEGMLEQAQAKLADCRIDNVTFEILNGRELPFADNTLDTIISFKFFHLIPNEQKTEFMAEFARVLKPKGKLIVEFNSPFYGFCFPLWRYRRKLRKMTKTCFFPGQGRWLFRGYRVGRVFGAKFPFFAGLARIFGSKSISRLSLLLGRIPGVRFLAYTVIFELYNEKQP